MLNEDIAADLKVKAERGDGGYENHPDFRPTRKTESGDRMTAFSNGSEYDYWSANWCRRCVKDDAGLAAEGVWCKILTDVMLNNEVPPQWKPGTDDLRDRYHCSEFEGAE